ncbi:hypothetical protein ACFP1I_23260 [Dyadobacter subterraneus]|uniref:Restriction endonuclease n=1 Tax=Dyadobacter subterraneus TaxID=2773304 RepID=A0ABR9W8V6_9BACT|nr:hypothetical protein [Dyadobacter subterraneus]MBE9461910.1 hypothetical protein [Dyadobacter subterraneus]
MDNRLVIREYLESLTEDQELDAIFPLLLVAKGFRVLATPANSKGQSQYGKDIVAIGKDEKGVVSRFYCELKGGRNRNVDDHTFYDNDGIRMSLLEAKDTPFLHAGVPAFEKLPIKYVLVHNGDIKENIRQSFEGFTANTFPDGNFERWDLDWLTQEFDKYLFNEHLIPNQIDSRLFRRVLLLIDTPDYNQVDFRQLVKNLLARLPDPKQKRKFRSAWATLALLGRIVWNKCRQNENLYPAIDALNFLLLESWAEILRRKFDTSKSVLREFRRLVKLHFSFLREYFKKTSSAAALPNGLFVERSGPFEEIGYPMRSFEYLGLLIYYFEASRWFPDFESCQTSQRKNRLEVFHKRYLKQLLESNSGCQRPLLDSHSIPILATVLYILSCEQVSKVDRKIVGNYIIGNLDSIFVIKDVSGRFPSISLNLNPLIEYVATANRPFNYSDESSLLIPVLLDLMAFLNLDKAWVDGLKLLHKIEIDFQVAIPNESEFDIEQRLFENHLDEEFHIESSIEYPKTAQEYRDSSKNENLSPLVYRTDKAGFPFLRTLAHVYYKSEFFPADVKATLSATASIK